MAWRKQCGRTPGHKDPWGLKGSFMARHELEQYHCLFKILWGPKQPWNSLNTRNYMYDLLTYFLLSSPAVLSAADALFQGSWRTDFSKLKMMSLFLSIVSGWSTISRNYYLRSFGDYFIYISLVGKHCIDSLWDSD